jgi:hypothetical protein
MRVKNMSKTVNSVPRNRKSMSGLNTIYEKKKAETLIVLKKAAEKLADEGTAITLGRLSEATRAFSDNGKRIAETTILRNQACREYYEEVAKPVRRKPSAARALRRELGAVPSEKEKRRMTYLTRLCKADLISMVVRLEGDLGRMEANNAALRERLLLPELELYVKK